MNRLAFRFPVLTHDQWVKLDIALRQTLARHDDNHKLYLVDDLLDTIGKGLEEARLTPWETARKFYATFPERLPLSGEDLPCPLFELDETPPARLLL